MAFFPAPVTGAPENPAGVFETATVIRRILYER
jgi:hypothetical protein